MEEDIPFIRETVPLEEAVDYFKATGEQDKVTLLKYRQRKDLVLYRAKDVRDYHHGYMVPSSGYLQWFELNLVNKGFVLRFPRRHAPNTIEPLGEFPTLLKTFQEYGDWLNKLGIPSVGALNDAIKSGHFDEVVLVSELFRKCKFPKLPIKSPKPETKLKLS